MDSLPIDYINHLVILIGIYLILAQGFNLCFGLGKLLNLSHIAIYSLGAYTTALLSTELQQSIWICLPASIAICSLFALLIGAISLKLSQDYFAIGTLAFSSVVTALLINWKELTRGVLGIPGIPRPEILGIDFYQNTNFLCLVLVLLIFSLTVTYISFQSGFSRSLRAQSENEFAAMALGKNLAAIRNDCFILSSAMAGLAGSLYAYYINYIDPSSFSITEMVFVLSIVILGKPGSFWGVNLATIFLILLPQSLTFIDMPASILGPLRQMLHAFILFGLVYWNKETLFPPERKA